MTKEVPESMRGPVYDENDARALNGRAGLHWFSPDSMRFFSCRVQSQFYLDETRRLSFFVSSERDRHDPRSRRLFTVRSISWDTGEVRTVGGFQFYGTARTAHKYASAYAKGEPLPAKG